jgi:large conductance mechanosensitive channel
LTNSKGYFIPYGNIWRYYEKILPVWVSVCWDLVQRFCGRGDKLETDDETPLLRLNESMTWLNEFKAFALKGSMIDLAIGVVIGAAFGRIVNSLVNDIIMPPIGLLIGGVNFKDLAITLKDGDPPVQIRWGLFINNLIDFAIIAICIFFVIKFMNRLLKLNISEK